MELMFRALYPRVFLAFALLLGFLFTGPACMPQQRILANLPDAPLQQEQSNDPAQKGGAAKTTYNLLSRRSFFFPDLAYTTKPLNARQKFLLATAESIAPSALIVAAM